MSAQRILPSGTYAPAEGADPLSGMPELVLSQEHENAGQHDRLLKRLDDFLHLHEGETAPHRSSGALSAEIRNGVLEDLKPLLHTIIELLELSVRRGSAVPETPPDPGEQAGMEGSSEISAGLSPAVVQELSEDLPSALPEILTKSVEELVEKRQSAVKEPLFAAQLGFGKNKLGVPGPERAAGSRKLNPQAWIPVTSGTFKP